MDAREVQSKGNALQKALSAKEPAANIINILKDLQKNVKPSEELLRKTQIGKIVNKVKAVQGVDPSIPRLASEIVAQWRTQIQAKTTSGASTPNGVASPTPPSKAGSISQPSTTDGPTGVHPDKRSRKTDNVPLDSMTKESGRNNSIGLIYDGLVVGSSLPMKQILELAGSIEAEVFALPTSQGNCSSAGYKEKIRSLFSNLRNKSNPELRQRILAGSVKPAQFVVMSHEEMKSKEQRKEDERIAKENMNNAMVAQEVKSVSSHLECPKCHQKKVSFTQAQTRSADEPMTTFCECLECGKRWKFS